MQNESNYAVSREIKAGWQLCVLATNAIASKIASNPMGLGYRGNRWTIAETLENIGSLKEIACLCGAIPTSASMLNSLIIRG